MPLRKSIDKDGEPVTNGADKRGGGFCIAGRCPSFLDACLYGAFDCAFGGVEDECGVGEVIAMIMVSKGHLKDGGGKFLVIDFQTDASGERLLADYPIQETEARE